MPESIVDPGLMSLQGRRSSVVAEESWSTAQTRLQTPEFTTTELAPWLRVYAQFGVLLCTTHQTCFTPGINLHRHNRDRHAVKGQRTKDIESWVAE